MEGAQVKALADELHEALSGQCVERIDLPPNRWQANVLLMNCAGTVIQRVHSRGKWLLFDFSHGITWLCHLLTRAGWHVHQTPALVNSRLNYGLGKAAPSAPAVLQPVETRGLLTVRLRNGSWAQLSGRPLLVLVPTLAAAGHAEIKTLGPDPLDVAFGREEFLYRLRQSSGKTLAAALLDQHVIAGLGNQSKCEILFACHLAPETRVAALYASQLERIANVTQAISRKFYRHYAGVERQDRLCDAYDHAGESCAVCGMEIAVDRSAGDGHWTWHCPACQSIHRDLTLFEA